jgi:hypothetical protein
MKHRAPRDLLNESGILGQVDGVLVIHLIGAWWERVGIRGFLLLQSMDIGGHPLMIPITCLGKDKWRAGRKQKPSRKRIDI